MEKNFECLPELNYFTTYEDGHNGLIESAIYSILGRKHNADDYKDFSITEYNDSNIRECKLFYQGVHRHTVKTVYSNPITVELITI